MVLGVHSAQISIHALHEESDTETTSLRCEAFTDISIHALHEESDTS